MGRGLWFLKGKHEVEEEVGHHLPYGRDGFQHVPQAEVPARGQLAEPGAGGWVQRGVQGGQRCSASRWSQRTHRGGASSGPQNCSSFIPAPHARQDAGHLVPGAGRRRAGGGESTASPEKITESGGGQVGPEGAGGFPLGARPRMHGSGVGFPRKGNYHGIGNKDGGAGGRAMGEASPAQPL